MPQNPVKAIADPAADQTVRRRDFINIAAISAAGVAGLAMLDPLIGQMAPSAAVMASGGPVTVDIGKIEAGQQIVVAWRSNPVFIVNRTAAELATLQQKSLLDRLRDPNSQEMQQPDYAKNWHRSITPEFLVLIGVCTHLGCIPEYKPEKGSVGGGWPGGYFCPCHGSRYDLAGRVYTGVPAPYNLPVPPHHFVDDKTIMIGTNPGGSNFAVSSIKQM